MIKELFFLIFLSITIATNDPNCGTRGPKPTARPKPRPRPITSLINNQSLTNNSSLIIGGVDARKNEFPWQGSLRLRGKGGGPRQLHLCGCSLINTRWAVTAAHCVEGMSPENLLVVFGEHRISADDQTEQLVDVGRTFVHPNYQGMRNDVALLQLRNPVEIKTGTATICLPDKQPIDQVVGYSPCVITGWGVFRPGGMESPDILQKASATVHWQSDCESMWGGVAPDPIDAGMVCVGGGPVHACYGDSGGPLSCQVDGRWYLFGVTSWGYPGCDNPDMSSVYARVTEYSEWIWSVVDNY